MIIKMPRLEISLLGSFQVILDEKQITDFRSDKARALLAYLAVESGSPHRREALANLLWPEIPDQSAQDNLNLALLRLRRSLEPFLLITPQTIQFNDQEDVSIDVVTFNERMRAVRRHRHRQTMACQYCTRLLIEAVALYRGDFITGLQVESQPFEEWMLTHRQSLHRQALDAFKKVSDYHDSRGEFQTAQAYAHQALKLEPWNETAHRQLMRSLALNGHRTAALVQYEACQRAISDATGSEPNEETRSLADQIRAGARLRVEGTVPVPRPSNLPIQLSTFIGRQAELAQVNHLLEDRECRLVTITGPGGIGKTSLALQAGTYQAQAGSFPHGVHYVPLAAFTSPGLLVTAIADTLGLSFSEQKNIRSQLIDYLGEKELLLLLDNFEQLLYSGSEPDGAGLVDEILRSVPSITLLITSREPLNLNSETVLRMEGLPYPALPAFPLGKEAISGGEIETFSAVQLFLDRARRANPDFRLAGTLRPAAVHICQLVEGMPLGVELAAACVSERSPVIIAQEIARNLSLLVTARRDMPARQRSLRAAFEYSWSQLNKEEQSAYRRLSVFVGGFRREAAEAVAGAGPDLMTGLVSKALVRLNAFGQYEIHRILTQYAEEKFWSAGTEIEATLNAHCAYYAEFVRIRTPLLKGGSRQPVINTGSLRTSSPVAASHPQAGQMVTLAQIGAALENIRKAWDWATAFGKTYEIESMLEGIFSFCTMRSRFQEGEDAFRKAAENISRELDASEASQRPAYSTLYYLLARILARRGWFLFHLQEVVQGKELLQKSLSILRAVDDGTETAFCLGCLGTIAFQLEDYADAQNYLQESLKLYTAAGDLSGEALARQRLGKLAFARRNYIDARQHIRDSLTRQRALDDRWGMRTSLTLLGLTAFKLEDYTDASHYFNDYLTICKETGDRRGVAHGLIYLGQTAIGIGVQGEAERLFQESLGIFKELGDQIGVVEALTQLGHICTAQGKFADAQAYFRQALRLATELKFIPRTLSVIIEVAALFAQGEKEKAAETLALIQNHPVGTLENQHRAEELWASLTPGISPQLLAQAQERSNSRSLDSLADRLLEGY